MKNWVTLLKANWSEVLSEKYFTLKYIVNLVCCYTLYIYITHLLVQNRFREGVVLCDPIQKFFTPVDFSLPIFVLTYACAISFIVYIIPRPRHFYFALRAFLVVFLFRFAAIYLIALSPPQTMIPLNDPVIDWIVGNNHEIYNDLFFSGHVADVCIFIFCCRSNWLRGFLLVSVFFVAVMLVWQQVHYTADVLGAPFFAYVSYVLFAKKGIRKYSDNPLA